MENKLFKNINLKSIFSGEKKTKLIIALCIIGIALIFLSEIFSNNNKQQKPVQNSYTSKEYAYDLEHKLTNLLSGIEGAGKVEVLITLESGLENVYALEEKNNSESNRDVKSDYQKTQNKQSTEEKYVIVDSQGKREALMTKQLEPLVKGVVVSCKNADNVIIKEMIINAVTTALDITSNKVCVVKKQ